MRTLPQGVTRKGGFPYSLNESVTVLRTIRLSTPGPGEQEEVTLSAYEYIPSADPELMKVKKKTRTDHPPLLLSDLE